MKKLLILLIVPFMMLASCMEDTSAYLPQDKENVGVDAPSDGGGEPTPPAADELIPGIQLVTLFVEATDGTVLERKFKYFMPVSIDKSKPISLVFELHGSWEYEGVVPPNPIANFGTSHPLNQLAIKENFIVVLPAGLPHIVGDGSGKNAVNWTDAENNLKFIDAIVDYFKAMKPLIDTNRIYSTGQSSGAIFSYVLAFDRSDVFAAIAPRAGQMSLAQETSFPNRTVPIIAFNGVDDDIVDHTAAVNNIIAWAEKVGNYFVNDMVYNATDTSEIVGYKKYLSRSWSGGKADIRMISILDEGHGVSQDKTLPMMWEFLSTHPMNAASTDLYITASEVELIADCNRTYELEIKYTAGATITYNIPADWNPVLEGDIIKLRAPKDFFATLPEGEFIIRAELNGITKTRTIPFKLKEPKLYYKIGDIYYNDNYEAVGIVFWVNTTNSREAKIINLEKSSNIFYNGRSADELLGADFETPNMEDGEGNTKAMVDKNRTLAKPNTSANSLFMWANEYSYKGINGWYLPAINEYKDLAKNITLINQKIKEVGGVELVKMTIYTSTVALSAGGKTYHAYDFTNNKVTTKETPDEYLGYLIPRAMKKVQITMKSR